MTAGLRVQIGSTPEPTRNREVRVRKADIMTTQSRARRVSACQISLKPRRFRVFGDLQFIAKRVLVLHIEGKAWFGRHDSLLLGEL